MSIADKLAALTAAVEAVEKFAANLQTELATAKANEVDPTELAQLDALIVRVQKLAPTLPAA